MLEKHRVIIHGNTIEWEHEPPPEIQNGSVSAYVVLEEESIAQKDQKMAPDREKAIAALRKIAEKGGISSISDPVKWQREIRKDRPLIGP